MCGRYSLSASLDALQLSFELEAWQKSFAGLAPNYNVAPTHDVPIVLQRPLQDDDATVVVLPARKDTQPTDVTNAPENDGDKLAIVPSAVTRDVRALSSAHWGLIPPWSKDGKNYLINARIETAAEKPSFVSGLDRRRCIIPADGYFEWKHTSEGKEPYFIQRADGEIIGFAGIYGWWRAPDSSWVLTTTIFTRSAESKLSHIHNRTPVILERNEFATWLDPAMDDARTAQEIVARSNAPLTFYRVRKDVGNVANNSAMNVVNIDSASDEHIR